MSFSPFAADHPDAPKRRISNAARRRVHARERRVRRTQKAARAQLPPDYLTAPAAVPAPPAPTTYEVQPHQPYHQPVEYSAYDQLAEHPVYQQPTEQYGYYPAAGHQAPPANQPIDQQPIYPSTPPQPYRRNPLAA